MVAKEGKGWRLARALVQLEAEVNAKYPNRRKGSDGSIGDEAHQARSSDHNAWIHDPSGVRICSAIDLTHDPASGFDSYSFAEWLRTRRDPRVKYVISNRRIFSSEVAPWQWRRYTGSNPHDHHVHISVQEDAAHYDDPRSWGIADISLAVSPPAQQPKPQPRALRLGDTGDDVKALQIRLANRGLTLKVDGDFGPKTEAAVEVFQKNHGLYADGIVGPQTWKALA